MAYLQNFMQSDENHINFLHKEQDNLKLKLLIFGKRAIQSVFDQARPFCSRFCLTEQKR